MAFGWDDLLGVGLGMYGAYEKNKRQQKADGFQQQAVDTANKRYDERAPLRRQGMQILGQSEAPINMGNLSYNAANPFAAAQGPGPSNATRFQSQPGFGAQQVDAALNSPQSAPPSQLDDMVAHLPGNVRGRDQIIARMRAGVQPLSGQQPGVGNPRIGMQPLGMGT